MDTCRCVHYLLRFGLSRCWRDAVLTNRGESFFADAKVDVSESNEEFVLDAVDCLRLSRRVWCRHE